MGALVWSEFEPRLGLLQGLLQGRRVLEVGTQDARSLLRLVELGASSVVGTHPEPPKVRHRDALPRSVDLLAMDAGRLDFEDGRFDAVVVADLARAQSANGRFLRELRRVLASDGLGLLVFEAEGETWSGLVDDPARLSSPEKLIRQIQEAFPKPRIFAQTPFAGVAIRPQEEAPFSGGISLDPRREPDPPSHLLALVGQVPIEGREHTLVEVGFAQVREQSDRIKARADADRERLAGALGRVQRALSKRDATLDEIQRRLPRIRAALHERSALPAPTLFERQVEDDEPLRARIRVLEAELEAARSAPPPTWYGSSIEPTRWEEAPSQDPRLREQDDALRQELERLRAEWSDSHRREKQLQERLVEQSSAHETKLAAERAEREALVERLHAVERERDALQQAVDDEGGRSVTEQQLSEMAESARWEQARLQRALEEAHAEIQMLTAKNLSLAKASKASEETERSRDGDRRALELTASHLAQEVETLRGRNQALREERDALARTSELLLEERDQATADLEQARTAHADLERQLELQAQSLEQFEAAQRDGDAARAAAEAAQAAEAAARAEDRARAERTEAELRARMEGLEEELRTAAARIRELDGKAGEVAKQEEARKAAEELVRTLEAQVVDALRSTAEAQQERRTFEERMAVIEQSRFDLEQQLASALAEKARAEADAVQARTDRQTRATEGLRSDAELVRLRAELGRRLAQARQLQSERDEAIAGRDVALGEAARLSMLPPAPPAPVEEPDPMPALRWDRLRAELDAARDALEAEREERSVLERARDRLAMALDRQTQARWSLEEQLEAVLARSAFTEAAAPPAPGPTYDPELEERVRTLEGELEGSERQRGAWESLARQLEAAADARDEELSALRSEVGQAFDERTQAQQEKAELERELRGAREAHHALQAEAEEARQGRTEAEEAARRVEEAAEQAESAVEDLRRRLSESEAEAARAQQTADARAAEQDESLARVRAEIEAEARAARERADALAARLEEAERELAERREDAAALEDARARAEAADAELSSAVTALEEAQTSLAERNAEVERLQRRLERLDAELVEAERTAAEEKHGREQLAEQLEQETQRSRDLESAQGTERLAKTMSDLGEAKARLERLGRDVEGLRNEEAKLRERAERAEAELERATGETTRLSEALRKARQDEGQAQAQLTGLSRELQEAKAAGGQAESRARARAEELEAQIDRIAAEKEELTSALEREKARAQELAREEEQQRRKALELAQRLERLERGRPEDPLTMDAVKESTELQRQLDETRGELGRRLTELKTARRALESEKDKREQAEQRLAQAERAPPSSPPQGMRRAIELRDQEIGRLRSELEGLSAERDRLRGGIQDSEGEQLRLERRVAQLQASLDDHQRRMEQLRRELQDKTEQLRRLSR